MLFFSQVIILVGIHLKIFPQSSIDFVVIALHFSHHVSNTPSWKWPVFLFSDMPRSISLGRSSQTPGKTVMVVLPYNYPGLVPLLQQVSDVDSTTPEIALLLWSRVSHMQLVEEYVVYPIT